MKKGIRIIVVLIVIVLIAAVFFLKRETMVSSSADIKMEPTAAMEENTAETIESETETARIPLEYTTFDMESFLSPGLPLLLDMGSASCGPCLSMKPDLEAFYEESYGKVSVRYADVWKDASLTGGFPAMAVPVQYFFNADGTPYMPSEEMQTKLQFYMYTLKDTGEHVLTGHYGILSKEQMYMIFRDMGVDL